MTALAPPPSIDEAARVRAALARAVLPAYAAIERVGDVALLPHQRTLAARLAAHVARWRGALLAEPAGWGKTYAALAVVPDRATLTVIAPAALRARWVDALARTRKSAAIVGVEALSRRVSVGATEWVIVDESHHLRNPATRRYAAAAELCERARVLLLTATPIQNRASDLAAQLALFLGEGALALSLDELSRHVIRSGADTPAALPVADAPRWLHVPDDERWLARLARLPPPVPPRDGGAAGALLEYTLVRQWASSRAALLGGLRRRLAAAVALGESLAAGRAPSRHELAAWEVEGPVVQLAFPELLSPPAPLRLRTGALLRRVRAHERAVRALLLALRGAADPDAARARLLRDLLAAHPARRVVAFSGFAETVNALAAHLRDCPGMAWVTASGARVASGRIARAEILAQFGPAPPTVPRAERVRLLLTTDVLSEGLDLQGASVLVHLDLPWNPARLEQRVGRLRRLGSREARVAVYALAPPADAERLLRLERRLRAKLSTAATVGRAEIDVLPRSAALHAVPPPAPGASDVAAEVARRLEAWRAAGADDDPARRPSTGRAAHRASNEPVDRAAREVAAVYAIRDGWLAAVRSGGDAALVADLGDGATTELAAVLRALELAAGPAAPVDPRRATAAHAALAGWADARQAARLADVGAATHVAGAARRAAERRLAEVVAALGRVRRAALASTIARAREALAAPAGIGFDRRLEQWLRGGLGDTPWLEAVAAAAPDRGGAPAAGATGEASGTPVGEVLILLVGEKR